MHLSVVNLRECNFPLKQVTKDIMHSHLPTPCSQSSRFGLPKFLLFLSRKLFQSVVLERSGVSGGVNVTAVFRKNGGNCGRLLGNGASF